MSGRNTKRKRAKPKRRRPSSSHNPQPLADTLGFGDLPPKFDPQQLLAHGVPPQIVEMVIEAERAAVRGDTAPLEQVMGMLEMLAEISSQPESRSADSESARSCYPLSSPEAAEALFAFSSDNGMDPGYATAAEKAIKLDPNAVEALVTLGDLAKSADERLRWYRRACEAAKSKPRDVVAREMPSIRFNMGGRLVNEAQYADAVEVMLPGLDENPDDPDGMRFALIDLMLRLRWGDELQSLLNRYADDGIGIVAFARAIACFQASGPTRHANELLRAAHEAKPDVAPILASLEPMPQQPVHHYRAGSREEAFMIAGYLLPGIRSKDGTTRWIRETLELGRNPAGGAAESDVVDELGPATGRGDLDIALSLPNGRQTWLYHLHRAADGFYWALLFEEEQLVGICRFPRRPKTQQLRQFLLDSVCEPMTGRARKPRLLQVPTKADLNALRKSAGTYGVDCEQRRIPPDVKGSIKAAIENASRFLIDESSEATSPDNDAADVSDLPQTDEQWLMGVFQPPMWVSDRSTPYRPFLQLIVDATNGTILLMETSEDRPTRQRQIELLTKSMQHPSVGRPRRPELLVVDSDTEADGFPWAGSPVEVCLGDDDLRLYFDELIAEFLIDVNPVDEALSKQAGMTNELMARFYQSAARFYKAAPWTMVGGDKLIKLTQADNPGRTWGVSVIGQLGQTIGLSLIEDVDAARAFIGQDGSIEDLSVITIQFGEAFDMPALDFWYLERNGWKVAGEDAYPLVLKMNPGADPTCLSCDEIRMVDSLMSVIPGFLDRPGDEPFTIQDSGGNEFRMNWEIR